MTSTSRLRVKPEPHRCSPPMYGRHVFGGGHPPDVGSRMRCPHCGSRWKVVRYRGRFIDDPARHWSRRSSGMWFRFGQRLKAAVENAFNLFLLGRSW